MITARHLSSTKILLGLEPDRSRSIVRLQEQKTSNRKLVDPCGPEDCVHRCVMASECGLKMRLSWIGPFSVSLELAQARQLRRVDYERCDTLGNSQTSCNSFNNCGGGCPLGGTCVIPNTLVPACTTAPWPWNVCSTNNKACTGSCSMPPLAAAAVRGPPMRVNDSHASPAAGPCEVRRESRVEVPRRLTSVFFGSRTGSELQAPLIRGAREDSDERNATLYCGALGDIHFVRQPGSRAAGRWGTLLAGPHGGASKLPGAGAKFGCDTAFSGRDSHV